MVLLTDRLETVRADREVDRKDFVARTKRQEETVEALQMILPKLKSLGPQSAAAALVQLSKIGKSNPIAAFM